MPFIGQRVSCMVDTACLRDATGVVVQVHPMGGVSVKWNLPGRVFETTGISTFWFDFVEFLSK